MPQETLIFAGTQAEAYQFAREAKLTGYTVVTEGYHLKNKERGITLVLVGSWAQHAQIGKVEDEARRKGMPIMTGEQFLKSRSAA